MPSIEPPNSARSGLPRTVTYGGTARTLHIGPWPTISLADAREKCREARKVIAAGNDPVLEKKRAKVTAKFAMATSFREVAQEWMAKCEREGRAEVTLDKVRWLLGMAYPLIGSHPIDAITPIEALSVLRKVEGLKCRGPADGPDVGGATLRHSRLTVSDFNIRATA